MKEALLAVLLLLSLACGTASSKVPPAFNNSVFVLQVDGNSICTSFEVEDSAHQKRLISAGHCATDITPTSTVVAYNTITGSYPVHLLAYKNHWPEDYSVYEFTKSAPDSPLTIKNSLPEVGDEIWALIGPIGMNPFYVTGYFTGVVSCSQGEGSCQADKMYLVESPVGPGASGSPVMDERGRVFGIMVGSHPELSNMAAVSPLPKL